MGDGRILRPVGVIVDELVAATAALHDVREQREEAVRLLADVDGTLEKAKAREKALREEFEHLVDQRSRFAVKEPLSAI